MTAPQTAQRTRDDLSRLLSSLIERGVADDQNFPVLRRLSDETWEVSFDGADHVSIAMGDVDYQDIHRELREKRSYSVKLIDGGLLQLLYLFKGGSLVKHRLAFYPSPILRSFQDDPDAYMRDELFIDIVTRRIVPFPVRFDYDVESARDIVHPSCHLTLGDVDGCRIPVSAPLSPRWFIDFVLRNFYQTDKHDFVRSLPAHSVTFATTLTEGEGALMHMVVPYEACAS
ncbi:MAG: DUF2290 domain-containing protein [Thermomicrobium sp.]|nr:DUF2290 domain-containing protein [Thermomicrobium sp.]